MNTTAQSGSSSPCGCSGSAATASPCTCGKPECSTCLDQGYSRPRFFAGQLLTEDDLQSLGDYVAGKNRLHNRYLMGSGVVCGLEVTCHPCGKGRVLVNPGYAIDCCGNDIVVSCPQELDINKMVRDLQLKLRGGYDCGDPCAGSGGNGSAGNGSGSKVNLTMKIGSGTGETTDGKHHPARFCLYVDYCEQPTEPVSPYATDDPCGQQVCQPTRIREGFRFELRCPQKEVDPEICKRYWECKGDRTDYEKNSKNAEFLGPYAKRLLEAVEQIWKNPTPRIDAENYANNLYADIKKASALLDNLGSESLNSAITATTSVIADVASLLAQPSAKRLEFPKEVRKALRAAGDFLVKAKEILGDSEKLFPTYLERIHGQALAEVAETLSSLLPKDGVEARKMVEVHVPFERPLDLQMQLAARHVILTRDSYVADVEAGESIRDWLAVKLEQPQTSTHCGLLKIIDEPPPPKPANIEAIHMAEGECLGGWVASLNRGFKEIDRDCFCRIWNPPCPSCDDPGVLLACLTVQDCQVLDICNLERQFVLAPVSLRYWIPEVQRMQDALEDYCCPGHECESEAEREWEKKEKYQYLAFAMRMIESACPRPDKDEERSSRTLPQYRPPSPPMVAKTEGMRAPSPESDAASIAEMRTRVTELHSQFTAVRDEWERLKAGLAETRRPAKRKPQRSATEEGSSS